MAVKLAACRVRARSGCRSRPQTQATVYRFGDFELDLECAELRERGQIADIAPKAFELLVFLVENRHRTVGSAELHEEVWKGRIVSDSALSSGIKFVRKALGDDGRRQAFVRTVRKRGFRFVAET